MMGDLLRVPEANVCGLSLRDAFVGVSKDKTGFFASGIADGTLGQAVLRRGRLTLDYAHSRILFEPGDDIADAWDYPDHCGWAIGKDAGGDWSVLHVAQGGPAAEAGLAAGDTIIELGGEVVAPLSRDELRGIWSGEGLVSGKRLRGTELREFAIKRRNPDLAPVRILS
jgi:predicted metalloprotease with PDZ domain